MKICKNCLISKDENEFYVSHWDKNKRRATCIACHKQYHQDNIEHINVQRKQFRDKNKERLNAAVRTDEYRKRKRGYNLKRRLAGKVKAWENNKRKTDPAFRLRKYLSGKVARALKSAGGGKNMSFTKHVTYTMDELKKHLENLFEPWMNWDNQGSYRVSLWNDDDSSTWTWQIDHIIPQSSLPYTSMEDENFRKCWALENLRPLSAKQNLVEGVQKIRHK